MASYEEERFRTLEDKVESLDVYLRGDSATPSFQERLMREIAPMITAVKQHAKNNAAQGDAELAAELEFDRKQRESSEAARQHQHQQNLALLKWIIGLLFSGAALGLTAIGLLIAVLKK
jgi:hypothetical protein